MTSTTYLPERDKPKARRKSKKASRKPYTVRTGNWIEQEGELPPLCELHNETAVWHKNKARSSGGQWACKTCSRLKSKGQRRAWKTGHTDPFTYNLKRLFTMAKHHSKKIDREFSITFDDLLSLWENQKGKCAITGMGMSYIPGNGKRKRTKITMDRIDSGKGYIAGNVWLVCDWANRAKSDSDTRELLLFANGVLKNKSKLPRIKDLSPES